MTSSAAGMAFKGLLRRRAPVTTAKLQRSIRAARRAWLEPIAPELSAEQLLWNPPPRRERWWPVVAGEVTNELFARLDEDDLAVMRSQMAPDDTAVWERADDPERRLLGLHFCVHYKVPGVLEKTGLSDAAPPAGVGASAGGSLAAGGSFYYADLVADALGAVGDDALGAVRADLSAQGRVLDFGCSDGRVVRVLAATYPQVDWHACDPDAAAVEWAAANFTDTSFFVSPVEPPLRIPDQHSAPLPARDQHQAPLPVPDQHFDYVYAIGIWTQYSERAALAWLEEMRRIVRRGGHLLITAHGYRSVEMHAGEWGNWPAELVADTATRLYADGHRFVGGYGKELSLASATPDWGEAFFTPEWLADHACPAWAIVDYKPGYVENNHDLYLLERRA